MQDVFVETSQLDFTGQVQTPVIDFKDLCCYTAAAAEDSGAPVETCGEIADPAGQCGKTPDGQPMRHVADVQAIETEDFLGDVFLCVDPISAANRAGTGHPGDVLAAHMYTSVATVIDWIAAHPGAQDTCQIVIRYSPFNNFPDVVQATSSGVRLGIDQSSGYGRVTDVTIFQPSLGTPAAP
jgi:hypothetical protein